MRILLTLFLLVNLCFFANGLDRMKILHKQTRKHESTDTHANAHASKSAGAAAVHAAKTVETAKASVAHAAAATHAEAHATQTTKATATNQATVKVAQAATTSAKKTQTQAAAKVTTTIAAKTGAAATTNGKATAKAAIASAASAKIVTKDASGKSIEHVTKEPAPAGMVRPVMIPAPDAIPNTYTVRPVVEGQEGQPQQRMMSHRRGQRVEQQEQDSSEEQPQQPMQASQGTEQAEMQKEEQPQEVTQGQAFSSDSVSSSSSDEPQFKSALKSKKNFGKNAVTAEEVSSLNSEAQAPNDDDDAFPPKYPPCSCEAQPQPTCCMMAAQAQSGGWWHKNGMGQVHFHHMHTADEDPEQVSSEDQQTANMDGDSEEETPAPEDDSEEDDTPAPEDDASESAVSSTGESTPVEAGDVSSSTGEVDVSIELTYATFKALLDESFLKNHESIISAIATAQQSLSSHIDEVKAESMAQLKILDEHVSALASKLAKLSEENSHSVIVENNIHHHHHHDDDDDDDDDDEEDDSSDDANTGAFASTGASTLDLLRSMEAQSEDLTNKLDQADVLDAASGDDDSE